MQKRLALGRFRALHPPQNGISSPEFSPAPFASSDRAENLLFSSKPLLTLLDIFTTSRRLIAVVELVPNFLNQVVDRFAARFVQVRLQPLDAISIVLNASQSHLDRRCSLPSFDRNTRRPGRTFKVARNRYDGSASGAFDRFEQRRCFHPAFRFTLQERCGFWLRTSATVSQSVARRPHRHRQHQRRRHQMISACRGSARAFDRPGRNERPPSV